MLHSRIFRILCSFLFLGAILAAPSCSKDDPEPAKAPEGAMIATLNGAQWVCEDPTGLVFQDQIRVTATADDGSKIVIYLLNDIEGNYSISGTPTSLLVNIGSLTPPSPNANNPVFASTNVDPGPAGEVNVTEIDEVNKTLTGTFAFKAARLVPKDSTIEVTYGSFTKIPYSDLPGVLAGNSVSFKVNGTSFSPIQLTSNISNDKIFISAIAAGGKSLSLTLPPDIGTGSFALSSIGSPQYALYVDNFDAYESVSGTLQITLHDKQEERIEGTFSFEGESYPNGGGTLSVSEGVFKVNY